MVHRWWAEHDLMFILDSRDKANLLIMTTHSNSIRNAVADFEALALPLWSLLYKVWSEGAWMIHLLYRGDFIRIWCSTRAVSREFRLAADALWWETCRQLVVMRMDRGMREAILIAMDLESSSPSSEVSPSSSRHPHQPLVMAPRFWTQHNSMFMLRSRDKANLLIMTTRSNSIRNAVADFDALALPHWSFLYKHWSEGARIIHLLYRGDFIWIWCTTRAVSTGFRLAADALWWETSRQLVAMRMDRDMSEAILIAMHLDSSSSSSEVSIRDLLV